MNFAYLPRSGELPPTIVIELTVAEARSVETIVNEGDFMGISGGDPHLTVLTEFLRKLKRTIPDA